MTKKAISILLVLYLQSSMYYIYVTLYSFSYYISIITTKTNHDLKISNDSIEDIVFYLKVYNTKKEALNLSYVNGKL